MTMINHLEAPAMIGDADNSGANCSVDKLKQR